MSDLSLLPWLMALGAIAVYWWHSGVYKGRARSLAHAHCADFGLQLLDHSVVIIGFWPARDARGQLRFRRRYRFEFASTGDRRYRGELVLLGMELQSIRLEAYKLPDSE